MAADQDKYSLSYRVTAGTNDMDWYVNYSRLSDVIKD